MPERGERIIPERVERIMPERVERIMLRRVGVSLKLVGSYLLFKCCRYQASQFHQTVINSVPAALLDYLQKRSNNHNNRSAFL